MERGEADEIGLRRKEDTDLFPWQLGADMDQMWDAGLVSKWSKRADSLEQNWVWYAQLSYCAVVLELRG